MNERIRELAGQAGWYITDDDEHSTLFGKFVERFAELIVRECIEISQVGSITEEKIKEHFGVEE